MSSVERGICPIAAVCTVVQIYFDLVTLRQGQSRSAQRYKLQQWDRYHVPSGDCPREHDE